jgi:PST family polysaccharide transporter
MARVVAAVTGIVMARAVGPSALGAYAAAWAMIELSVSLSELGMVTGLKREAGRSYEDLPHLLGNALLVRTAAGAIALVIAWALFPLIAGSSDGTEIFVPLAVAGLAILFSEPLFAVLQIRGEQQIAVLFGVTRGLIFLVCVVTLMIRGQGIIAMAWTQAAIYAAVAGMLAMVVLARTPIALRTSRVAAQMRGAFVFGASEMIYAVYLNIPLLAVAHFCASDQTGYFAVAHRFLALFLAAGLAAHHEAFLPAMFRLYKHDRPQFMEVCAQSQRIFVTLGVMGASTLFVLAEPLVVLLQGEAYRPAVPLMRLLAWLVLVNLGYYAADAALTAGDHMRDKIKIQANVTLMLGVLVCILGPQYGTWGVCGGVIAAAVALLVQTVACARMRGVMPAFPMGGIMWRLCATVACAIVASLTGMPHIGGAVFLATMCALWWPSVKRELRAGMQ